MARSLRWSSEVCVCLCALVCFEMCVWLCPSAFVHIDALRSPAVHTKRIQTHVVGTQVDNSAYLQRG